MIIFFCIYGVFWLQLVRWYFRTVSPQNLSSYYSGGEDVPEHFWYTFLLDRAIAGLSYGRIEAIC